jgi:hypothetical protein
METKPENISNIDKSLTNLTKMRRKRPKLIN